MKKKNKVTSPTRSPSHSFTHFGSFYSRNIHSGDSKTHGYLLPLDLQSQESSILFSQLAAKLQQEISNKLTEAEKKFKFPVEMLILFSKKNEEIAIQLIKKAKISPLTYPKVLTDLLKEKIISEKELLKKIPLDIVKQWFSSKVDTESKSSQDTLQKIAQDDGLTYGAATGRLINKKSDVEKFIKQKKPVVWIIDEVSSNDIKIFPKVQGLILTSVGATSHAAVLARGLGIPTISGCRELLSSKHIDQEITIDADKGIVYKGHARLTNLQDDPNLEKIIKIAKKHARIIVQSNSDKAPDAQMASKYGAEGIGLCRTEHMFFGDDETTNLIRKVLFSDPVKKQDLARLMKIQTKDFYNLFNAVKKDNDVVVRFLDAPLHEFLPKSLDEVENLAQSLEISKPELKTKLDSFHEKNPMLGFRGIRILLKRPEIIQVQTSAVIKAALKLQKNDKKNIQVILEAPLVIDPKEVEIFKEIVKKQASLVDPKGKVKYQIGTMIETPRAALMIEKIAPMVDLISYGTNDLTQMTCGISRDDNQTFIGFYQEAGIIDANPFVSLDQELVGELIKTTTRKAKKTNPKIKVGLCGEQGGEPASIEFLINQTELDSISCSPARVPIAVIAAGKFSTN